MQFSANLVTEHPLVKVMISTSVITLMSTKNHTATLATHTNFRQDTSTAVKKPNLFLLEVISLLQLKLKCFFK